MDDAFRALPPDRVTAVFALSPHHCSQHRRQLRSQRGVRRRGVDGVDG